VRELLETLPAMEARILRWRFGLDDEDELTLKEIGDKYNLSRERIRQLQEQALGKLRRTLDGEDDT
jgi:RNA polymerase primary sigma factor